MRRKDHHASFLERRAFGSLDGLRCMSIVPVVFHHAHGSLDFGRIGRRGFLGVDLFFVISGFLIVTLLLRERDRNGEISLRRFYARRALRIMPLYYGLILALAVLFGTVARNGTQGAAFFGELPYYLTYTTNWVPITTVLAISWSLSAEEQFYLLWPPIERWVRRPLVWLGALLLLAQLVQLHLLDDIVHAALGKTTAELPMLYQTTFTPILLGVLLAHVLHVPNGFAAVARVLGGRWASMAVYAALVACMFAMPEDLSGPPRTVLHLLMTGLVASVVVREDHALAPILTFPLFARIGALSYGIYLLHMLVVGGVTAAFTRAGASDALLFPCVLLGTLLLAELSFRFYEAPFLRLKARFEALPGRDAPHAGSQPNSFNTT